MTTNEITCYGKTTGANWQQEWYESASKDAGRRARQLRKDGFRVTVAPMGIQVTAVGTVKMTMVDIRSETIWEVPEVKVVRI